MISSTVISAGGSINMEKNPEAVATAMEFEEKEAMWARILAKMEELSSALDRVLGSPSASSTRINAAASSPLPATTEGTCSESDATPMPPAPTRCSTLCFNHDVIEPMVPFTLMASATAVATMPLEMATVVPTASLQEEVGQLGAPEVFDETPERIRSGAKHHRFVKWVSRVRIMRRPVCMAFRKKFGNSVTTPCQETAPKPLPWPSFQFVTLLRCNSKLATPEKKAWCQNAFSPGEKQLHMVHLDGILFGAKEWVLRMDTCGITCMLKWRFRLSSDQGQGELFACSAGKLVEVPSSIFSLNIMMESAQCSAINVLELFFRNIWWVLEVIFWMNSLDTVDFSYCTHEFALAKGFVLRMMWSGAWLLNYQGAQAVGMGKEALNVRAAAELFDKANDILGYDLLNLCIDGPKEKLNSTVISQPAIYVTSLAAVEVLRAREEGQSVIDSVDVTCGLSLGEYTALAFAGAFSFEDGLKLVKLRGEAMQDASDAANSAMVSVIGLDSEKVQQLCDAANEDVDEKERVQIANFLCPGNYAVSGGVKGIEAVESKAKSFKARMTVRLAVAGAFHTSFMQPAVSRLEAVLAATEIRPPRIPVISNVDAQPHSDPDTIKKILAQQVTSPVQWETTVTTLLGKGLEKSYELGPGKVIAGIIKRINKGASVENIGA